MHCSVRMILIALWGGGLFECYILTSSQLAPKIALVGYVHTIVMHTVLFEFEQSKDMPIYIEVDSNFGSTMPANFMSLTQTQDLLPLYTKAGHYMQLQMVYALVGLSCS